MQRPLLALVVAACLAALISGQYLPTPKRYPGVAKGNPTAPVVLEEFADFQCQDCKMAWPVVKQVLDYYGPDKIYYMFHAFPLWSHRQAWDVALAATVVAQNQPDSYWDFADYLFANQASFLNEAFFNKTEADLYSLLATYAAKFGVDQQTFLSQLTSDEIYAIADADKHLGILNQVYATPTFVVNGFKANIGASSTFADWKALIDPLLS